MEGISKAKTEKAENKNKPLLEMSSRRRWAVTAGVMTGMFIAALEATVVGTAMPTVIASLGGLNYYSWVFSAYLVTSTVTVPVWGKLSDLYGRRLLYQIGIAVFLLGTLLSGFSTSMTQLIIFRAVQGLGAGALVPLGMTIIGDIFTLQERAKMQAYFSGVWGLSSVIGPVVGGFITDQISWRWVFFINLPVGILAALIIGFALKEPKHHENPTIDYAGAGLLMLAISLLMLAMVEGGTTLTTLFAPENLLLFASAVILLLIFFWVEKKAADPIIPFELFRNKTVAVSVAAGFLAGVAMFGVISFVPLFAQGALGSTATEAGSLLTPLMLSWVLMSIVGGRLLLKVGYRTITIIGFVILTVGFVLLALFQRETARFWLYVDLVLIGAGLGLTMLTLLIAVQQVVERTKLGVATSLNQFSRAIGGAFGVAIMGAFLTAGLAAELDKAARSGNNNLTVERAAEFAANPNALIDPQAKADLPDGTLEILQTAMATSIHRVFWIGGGFSLLALLVTFLLPLQIGKSENSSEDEKDFATGEKMLMAEQTTINARNEPTATTSRQ
ncbi:MAG: MFS transporter [Acidobacteria bacterium]|nr:MFS transporter [Acidobacteriota bacterium]MCA1638086.1 MFS transporter [Acidobacteriota bacterium]